MADEEQHEIVIPLGMTNEQREQIEAIAEDFVVSVSHMFLNMNKDDLTTLIKLMNSAMQSEDTRQIISFWSGVASGFVYLKHDTCFHCMKAKHDVPDDASALSNGQAA